MNINEIETTFKKTGEKTPGGGLSYISENMDMCATVYHRKKAKVFYNRREGFEDREKTPCFYKDMTILEH